MGSSTTSNPESESKCSVEFIVFDVLLLSVDEFDLIVGAFSGGGSGGGGGPFTKIKIKKFHSNKHIENNTGGNFTY